MKNQVKKLDDLIIKKIKSKTIQTDVQYKNCTLLPPMWTFICG